MRITGHAQGTVGNSQALSKSRKTKDEVVIVLPVVKLMSSDSASPISVPKTFMKLEIPSYKKLLNIPTHMLIFYRIILKSNNKLQIKPEVLTKFGMIQILTKYGYA